jgi:hypothetical protein
MFSTPTPRLAALARARPHDSSRLGTVDGCATRANPQGVLLAVDVSPRWLCGHTLRERCPDPEQKALALAHDRIADLMGHIDTLGWPPPICVESDHFSRVYLDDLKWTRIVLCGLYGDRCVSKVARQLQARAFQAVILEDACLWSAPLIRLTDPDDPDFYNPELARIPRTCVRRLFPDLGRPARRDLWRGEPPSF